MAPCHPPFDAYVEALLLDLEQQLELYYDGREIVSIFIGGGTPSLFDEGAIARLIAGVYRLVPLSQGCEITLEANPGSADCSRFAGYASAGVNRISLGIQSFDDDCLRALGRVHNSRQVWEAIRIATHAFERVNLDLMYGLPGQVQASAVRDLRAALECSPGHISWYQLTLEPNTLFYRQPPDLPTEDAIAAMFDVGAALLDACGYRRYEVSAWAQTGQQCVHNVNYWTFGDYCGIGCGAHGKWSDVGGAIQRTRHGAAPLPYIAAMRRRHKPFVSPLREEDIACEFMLNALRLTDGFERSLVRRRGVSTALLEPGLRTAQQNGWLQVTDQHIAPTATGFRFLNEVQLLFLPPQQHKYRAGQQ